MMHYFSAKLLTWKLSVFIQIKNEEKPPFAYAAIELFTP